ncbi:hypothetical protein EGW08_003365 [Elysia chlorotica]|uniref:Uncharacterized protein n=1 Tax=Elysia chlorotica TaxID=188477 RepID=A0A3S0ZY57_ELYCH|nr:hypothetical protein EGW08_003365 [Elysia chlorotica]
MTRSKNAPAVGIDLGSSFSRVGVYQHGTVEVIGTDQGSRATPNYASHHAVPNAVPNAANTVFQAKRLLGRRFSDPSVQSDATLWPFRLDQFNWRPRFKADYKGEERLFAPEEISAMMLTKVKAAAEGYLGKDVKDVVITVPASFTDAQRRATLDAAAIAGLNVQRLIHEPTAAVLAYALGKGLSGKKNVLVFSLGGGAFGASVISIYDGSVFEVRATAGDSHLGGEDFDARLLNYFAQDFKRKHQKDLTTNPKAVQRLLVACERVKKTLTNSRDTVIDLDSLHEGVSYYARVSRVRFHDLCGDLFRKTIRLVEKAVKEANMDKGSIDEILLVGGSTRIPRVQKLLSDFFNGKELNKSLNPDESVAYGAALQAAILNEDSNSIVKDVLVMDINSFHVGVDSTGGVLAKIIERGNFLPTKNSKTFTTYLNNQPSLELQVFEGDRAMTKDNNILGKLHLTGIPHAPQGVPRIEISFLVDINGILHVFAQDNCTGKPENLSVTNNTGGLSQEEINQIVSDAEQYKEDDMRQRQRASFRRHLEVNVQELRETLENAGENLSNVEKRTVLYACNDALSWLDNNLLAPLEDFDLRQQKLKQANSILKIKPSLMEQIWSQESLK